MAGAQAQARQTPAGLRFLGALAAFAPTQALAGAWTAPDGGQEIWTNAVGERDRESYLESSAYIERPIADEWSFVAAPWVEQNYRSEAGWRGEAVVGLKRSWQNERGDALAVQAGGLWVSDPPEPCSEGGAEVRFLAGRNLGSRMFVNAEAATRFLEGGCSGARLDLTLGYRGGERWLGTAQVFVDDPDWGDEGVKAQLSLVRFSDGGNGLQLGVRARLDGDDPEPALIVGLWHRPSD